MATGVPQVVSDWDGYRDSVVEGETGFRVPTMWMRCDADLGVSAAVTTEGLLDHFAIAQSVAVDVGLLEKRLAALIENQDLRARLGAASRQRALLEYGWPSVIRRHEELWAELRAIALRAPPGPRADRAYVNPPFFDAFSGYATHRLSPSTRLVAGPAGPDATRERDALMLYRECTWLEEGLVERLLSQVPAGVGTITVKSLVDTISETPEPAALRHVMWLLKSGLLRIAS
jgi:hypothetical protein